jgi:polyisoprenyl-teichoic acid--peptidoglycan teichoic acid transferase
LGKQQSDAMIHAVRYKITTLGGWKIGLLIIFAIAAFLSAYVVYSKSRDFWTSYDITQMEGFAIKENRGNSTNAEGTPNPTPEIPQLATGPLAEPWDGASRVTMLVMGLDYRDWLSGEGPPRTDTMILLTLDPLAKTAGILNIPRDLWVNIPGFDYGRINTAYALGESYQVPNGGPGLAVLTVEELLGVPIDYYAQLDFYAFEKFVDLLGGVLIDVKEEIKIDPIGRYNTITLQPGEQRLQGPELLAYARARNTEGGDFDRADRQQQVILALKKRILKPEALAWLIPAAPEIYEDLSEGINTNMSLDVAIRLGMLVMEIPDGNIMRGAIGTEHIAFAKSPDGTQDVLKPLPDKIRLLRDEIFASTDLASPYLSNSDLVEPMRAEQARISILNGSSTEGLANLTQEYLNSQGATVVSTGNANELLNNSRVIDITGNPYTLRYLVDLMAITPYNIILDYNPDSEVDVIVILGNDWATTNPME